MRRVSKIGMPLGLAVAAGVVGGLVALGVANAGQQPQGDNRVVSDISSVSPAASPSTSATASPTADPTTAAPATTSAPQPAPTHAARQAQAVATDPATDPTTAPTDEPTTADPAPTGPINQPTAPFTINPPDHGGPGQG